MNKERCSENEEKCVLCHKSTGVPVDMPVEYRKNYVSGVGQLCSLCNAVLMNDDKNDR